MESGIHLDLSMDNKLLFPYVYLNEEIEKDGQLDETFCLYYVLLGDKKRAVHKEYHGDSICVDVRNYFSGLTDSYEFPLRGEKGIEDIEIRESGALLEFSFLDSNHTQHWHISALPKLNSILPCGEFEVLYIGKSGTGKQELLDRLLNHQTIAKIHRDVDKRRLGKELFILATGLKSNFIF